MTDKNYKAIEAVFNYVIKVRMVTLQKYRPDEEYRLFTPIAKGLTTNSDNFCKEVYVNLENPTPWQLKAFKQRGEKLLPGRWYIEYFENLNIVRIGFK